MEQMTRDDQHDETSTPTMKVLPVHHPADQDRPASPSSCETSPAENHTKPSPSWAANNYDDNDNDNQHEEEADEEETNANAKPSVSLASRKKDLRRLIRTLNSSVRGESLRSLTSRELSITDLRARIDAIGSSLTQQGCEDSGDDNAEEEEDDEDDNDDDDDDDNNFPLEESIVRLRSVLKDMKAIQKRSMMRGSIGSILDDDDEDDEDALLVKKLHMSSHRDSIKPQESVERVLINASILPCSVLSLKAYVKEEEEKFRENTKIETMRTNMNASAKDAAHDKAQGAAGAFRRDGDVSGAAGSASTSSYAKNFFGKGLFSFKMSNGASASKQKGQKVGSVSDDGNTSDIDSIKNSEPLHRMRMVDSRFPPFDELTDEALVLDEQLCEVFILHFLFRKFASPPPSFSVIRHVLEYERRRISNSGQFIHSRRKSIHEVDMMQDVVINVGDSATETIHEFDKDPLITSISFVAQILEGDILLRLPPHFRLAFLRILIRLLTSENDEQFDDDLSLEPKGGATNVGKWSHSRRSAFAGKSPSPSTSAKFGRGGESWTSRSSSSRGESWTSRNEDLSHLYDRNRKRHNVSFDCLYSVVRFRCGERPGMRVDAVISMIESSLQTLEGESRKTATLLLGPLCRLLGLLCTAGISPKQLRKILSLIADDSFRMNANIHLLRALIVAAEGSSLARKLRGKASPQCFFCFGRSEGISHTLHPGLNTKAETGWPFKTSFGMACWFRLERFLSPSQNVSNVQDQVLFKICSGDGTSFEVSFRVLGSSAGRFDNTTAANIVFSVRDSDTSRKTPQAPLSRSIEMVACPIVPRVWFHIAIRHVKSSYLSLSKDEVTVFLDGKPMLTEALRFPKPSTLVADSNQSKPHPAQPVEMTFCSGIDAEAGPLYVFDDFVSDETLHALYNFTSGTSRLSTKEVEPTGIMATIEKKVNALPPTSFVEEDAAIMTMKKADVEEIVIPRARTFSSNGQYSSRRMRNSIPTILDLIGDDEYFNEIHNPTKGEFSRQAFVSNIYFVWDPSRVCDNFVLDAHSGVHARLQERNCIPWKMHGAKDVISSIGGVQCLLPVLKSLICPETDTNMSLGKRDSEMSQIGSAVPLAFSLLAAFLRDKDNNGREWLRCGGTEILEFLLLQSKKRYSDRSSGHQRQEFWIQINAFRRHRRIAEDLVSILLDLKEACSYNKLLESKIYSRLIFNVDLWFGGLSDAPGIALHSVLFPTLSSLAKADPEEALQSIRTGLMMNLIREYTIVSSDTKEDSCFDSVLQDGVLTTAERRHLIDVIMGILLTVLSVEVKTSHLLPLIQFISFNLDMEWEANNPKDVKDVDVEHTGNSSETRQHRFAASEKACSLLMLLLQTRPVVPGLYETLNQCVGDTVSWLLCCMVNR